MGQKKDRKTANARRWITISGVALACVLLAALVLILGYGYSPAFGAPVAYDRGAVATSTSAAPAPILNKTQYNEKLLALAHVATSSPWYAAFLDGTTPSTTVPKPLWPVKTAYPNAGPILPFNRIVAYYGNFYSTGMGVLGEYPVPQMLAMLASTTAEWQAADPSTPVIPAIDYIAVTAQGSAGSDGMYRARMPADQVEKALGLANQVHGLLILDIQVGLSNVQTEIPLLKTYLEQPNVEIAIDPEFSMKDGAPPGTEIGTFDASDINWVANYMASIVTEYNLPPKVLIVHRFTEDMVTNTKKITPLPQVQIVMDMDGWGFPAKKVNTYEQVIEPEPVQFTGFKLFYKADLQPPADRLMTPAEVLSLTPAPSFIQYQ